jgi:Berberine and berberine like
VEAVAPLAELGEPVLDAFGPMPYVALQSMLDQTAPDGLHQRNFAEHLDALSDGSIGALVERFAHVTHPMAHVVLTLLGGAVERVAPEATAFPHRTGEWVAWVIGMWHLHEDAAAHEAWIRSVRAALRPYASGGAYVNALGDEPGDRVRAAYGGNWQGLVELKRVWDPDNVFRLNANVDPN